MEEPISPDSLSCTREGLRLPPPLVGRPWLRPCVVREKYSNVDAPDTRYAKTADDVHIAYQVIGGGPIDLVYLPGYASNVQWLWELPSNARSLERLAGFARLIVMDRRGTGLSDRFAPEDLPPLETLATDVLAVLDAVGSDEAVLFGSEDGCFTCAMFAATYPSRTRALVLYGMDPGPGKSDRRSPDRLAWREELIRRADEGWGTRAWTEWDIGECNPRLLDDSAFMDWYGSFLRFSASPAAAVALLKLSYNTSVWDVFPSLQAPTLVLHRTEDPLEPIENARAAAAAIPGARLVELPGAMHYLYEDADRVVDQIEEFLTGTHRPPASDRVLATVLFTDIVGSTRKAAEIGDGAWKELLMQHDERVRRQLALYQGIERDTAGDGFFATFDGPARAVRCALAIKDTLRALGLDIRAGVHTGEVELVGDKVAGLSVHTGARIAALAEPGEVLVSSTVKDLTAGSGLGFRDAGEHELRGIPDRWHLYRIKME
jgi:pimeloyl-ACP methyl ester carboxylesterase